MKLDDNRNRLNILIKDDGRIVEPTNGFIPKLVEIVSSDLNLKLDSIVDMCPYDDISGIIHWLCYTAGAMIVDHTSLIYAYITTDQIECLEDLKERGIYTGSIPYSDCN